MIYKRQLPLLPGYEFRDVAKSNFPKSHNFIYKDGITFFTEEKIPETICDGTTTLYSPRSRIRTATWIAYDKQILRFHAYFRESTPGLLYSSYQIKKVIIHFFLEDNTIQIVEPKNEKNEDGPRVFLSRRRITFSPPNQYKYISILDLNVNETIRIFDRDYYITGCDAFTRNFLTRAGITVPDSIETLKKIEQSSNSDKSVTQKQNRQLKISKSKRCMQFLKYDTQILKFNGCWKENSQDKDCRDFDIYYYLADDTIEIREVVKKRSIKNETVIFLKRGKLPKGESSINLPGENSETTVLNYLNYNFDQCLYIPDNAQYPSKKNFYIDSDFMIGNYINVYGRNILIISCDKFTQDFYRKKHDIKDFTPIPHSNLKEKIIPTVEDRKLPPYNGWGSHEDSEGNCMNLELKPPKINIAKLFEYSNYKLRFVAKMISKIKQNLEREFIITYFLSDNTISIFELKKENSGFNGGEFFKRNKFWLPSQNLFSSMKPREYLPNHFYLGAVIALKDYFFEIISADEFTLNYMENHPCEFPYADIEKIITKIKEKLHGFEKDYILKFSTKIMHSKINKEEKEELFISKDEIRNFLLEIFDNKITEHEIITVCRFFAKENKETFEYNREKIQAIVSYEIKKHIWNGFDFVKLHLNHINKEQSQFLPENKIYSIIKGLKMPLNKDLINMVLKVLVRNNENHIKVSDFLAFFDFEKNTFENSEHVNIKDELYAKRHLRKNAKELIDWKRFILGLGLQKDTLSLANNQE